MRLVEELQVMPPHDTQRKTIGIESDHRESFPCPEFLEINRRLYVGS